jgi:hypothetical protein
MPALWYFKTERAASGLIRNGTNSGSFNDGSLKLNSGCWGREFGGGQTRIVTQCCPSARANIGVEINANSVLLGEALGFIGSSFSHSEVGSLEDGDGTLDIEGSVLSLNGEGGVSRLSAFAAVCLADLVEMGVGDGVKLSKRATAEVEYQQRPRKLCQLPPPSLQIPITFALSRGARMCAHEYYF